MPRTTRWKTLRGRPRASRKRSTDSASRGRVYVGLGSNLGDRAAHLTRALTALGRVAPIRRVSSFYRTEPVGFEDQPAFYNAVAEVHWPGGPRSLLSALKKLERRLGRTVTFPGGPREIDLDILDFGGTVRVSPDPVLPHPRLSTRRFVLAPLSEIAPEWRDPSSGRSARELLADLPKRPGVRKLAVSSPRPGASAGPRLRRRGSPG